MVFLSLCKLIYPGFAITQFFVHLILRIIENPLTRAVADDCQLHQLRRPGDVVWDAVRDGDDERHRDTQKTLAHRAKTVVSEREDRRKELEHLRGALKCNGYPEWILRDLKEENNSDSEKEVETSGETVETSRKEKSKKIPVVIPYLKGFLDQMRRAF